MVTCPRGSIILLCLTLGKDGQKLRMHTHTQRQADRQTNTYVAASNSSFLSCIFKWITDFVYSAELPLRRGRGSYLICKSMNNLICMWHSMWSVYKPALSRTSALQRIKAGDVLKIYDEIIFNLCLRPGCLSRVLDSDYLLPCQYASRRRPGMRLVFTLLYFTQEEMWAVTTTQGKFSLHKDRQTGHHTSLC